MHSYGDTYTYIHTCIYFYINNWLYIHLISSLFSLKLLPLPNFSANVIAKAITFNSYLISQSMNMLQFIWPFHYWRSFILFSMFWHYSIWCKKCTRVYITFLTSASISRRQIIRRQRLDIFLPLIDISRWLSRKTINM